MKSNSEIRQEAKQRMSGNWGIGIVFILVSGLILSAVSSVNIVSDIYLTGISSLLSIFVAIPLGVGICSAFLTFVRGSELKLEGMFSAFNAQLYLRSVTLGILTYIYTFLWSLLLIVPGIIKSLSYSQAPYILVDNPTMSGEEAICESMKMMHGHKMDLFLIYLGFIGLSILSALLLCIPMLWLYPYYMTVFAKFYDELKAEQQPAVEVQ